MQNKFARTDLAAEAVGRLDGTPEGVFADTLSLHGCEVSRVVISSEAGAEALGKPMGKYLTLEMADYVMRRGQSFPDCAAALRDLLKSFAAVERAQSYLIACLGQPRRDSRRGRAAYRRRNYRHAAPEILASAGFCGVFVRIRGAPRCFGHDRH